MTEQRQNNDNNGNDLSTDFTDYADSFGNDNDNNGNNGNDRNDDDTNLFSGGACPACTTTATALSTETLVFHVRSPTFASLRSFSISVL
jgi:hypothetical protein